MSDNTICTQCGMHTQPKEYHPYAACLMFLACHDSRVVRANLRDVVAYNDKRLRDGVRALADQLDTEPPDNTLIHDDVGTVADVVKRLRDLLDGE